MIDAHSHIHDASFDGDREETVRRALESGVERIVTVGTNVSESASALRTARKYECVFATVSIHPEEYSVLPDADTRREWMERIGEMAMDPKTVAIGECGLDYHAFGGIAVTGEQKAAQKEGFLDHLKLAERVGKPIVIHARDSYEDVLDIVQGFVSKVSCIVLHCYQGNVEVTKNFLDLGDRVLFSFAGNITYPIRKQIVGTGDDIRESIRIIPTNRILGETDCPYLAPQKFRGSRNEPAYVAEVIRKIAEVKELSFEEAERAIEENVQRCFPGMFA